jgi:hypothetical protein
MIRIARAPSLLRRLRPVATLGLAACAIASPRAAAGQEPAGHGGSVVRGVVMAGPGEPVPYAVVALVPRFAQRFTDESGAFSFSRVPAGTYHIVARQVGFKPFDTTMVVAANQTVVVSATLERLTVELEEIAVVATRGCSQPGPPDAQGNPELAALFEQLKQSAQRYRLLATTYEFRYRMVRTFTDLDEVGAAQWTTRDTVEYVSSAAPHYRPGDVVGVAPLPDGTTAHAVILPTLNDLADSVFQANHCFTFTGQVEQDGNEALRFHFRPPEALQAPDLEGDVDLDQRSYQIRRASVSLTHADKAWDKMRSATSIITFAELLPNIVVQRRVESVQVLAEPPLRIGGARHISRYVEDQQLLDFHFLRPLPARQEPSR